MERGEAERGATSQAAAEADEWTRTKGRKGGPCGAHRGLLKLALIRVGLLPARTVRETGRPLAVGRNKPWILLAAAAFTSLQGDRLIYAESLQSLQADVQASSRAGRRGARVWWARVSADPQMSVSHCPPLSGPRQPASQLFQGLPVTPGTLPDAQARGFPLYVPGAGTGRDRGHAGAPAMDKETSRARTPWLRAPHRGRERLGPPGPNAGVFIQNMCTYKA